MFGSKNDFFKQSIKQLTRARNDVKELLSLKDRSQKDISKYIQAFDYFVCSPNDYDGATIVKDLVDVRYGNMYLDLDAMLHDFEYIMGANKSFRKKWRSDIDYIKNMELNGKGIRVFRFALLTLIGVVFVPYSILK